jgi:hypothetical protein
MPIWRIHIEFWKPKAININSEYLILLFFCNNSRTNAPQCCVIHILPVSLISKTTKQFQCSLKDIFKSRDTRQFQEIFLFDIRQCSSMQHFSLYFALKLFEVSYWFNCLRYRSMFYLYRTNA